MSIYKKKINPKVDRTWPQKFLLILITRNLDPHVTLTDMCKTAYELGVRVIPQLVPDEKRKV